VNPEDRVSLTREEDGSERKAIMGNRELGVHVKHVFDDKGQDPE
jgi:hypothetical protein